MNVYMCFLWQVEDGEDGAELYKICDSKEEAEDFINQYREEESLWRVWVEEVPLNEVISVNLSSYFKYSVWHKKGQSDKGLYTEKELRKFYDNEEE